jgi:hypothetical protein
MFWNFGFQYWRRFCFEKDIRRSAVRDEAAGCFRDLASLSNCQKRLQQSRRYAVDTHNDDFRSRLLIFLPAKPTNVSFALHSESNFAGTSNHCNSFCSISMKKIPLKFVPSDTFLPKNSSFWSKVPIAVFVVKTPDLRQRY